MTFDPDFYWTANGPHLALPGSEGPEQAAVIKILAELIEELQNINGQIQTVIDVGCGQGRLASFLLDAMPQARYSGLDLGQAQLDGTRAIRPEGTFYLSRLQDFDVSLRRDLNMPMEWDLVIASEVLLHIPPTDIQRACHNLLSMTGKYLITVDWTQPVSGPIAEWNWLHDYDKLLKPDVEIVSGLQSIFLKRM
jgi:SAM-dependent methyltransferase